MNASEKIKTAKSLFLITLFFWIIESWWFGWNDKPINQYEKTCDQIVEFSWALCLYFYFSPILKWIEKRVS